MAFAFEKLLVYQKAVDFADQICRRTEGFPRGYGFLTLGAGDATPYPLQAVSTTMEVLEIDPASNVHKPIQSIFSSAVRLWGRRLAGAGDTLS
jgi:hypothetical protein